MDTESGHEIVSIETEILKRWLKFAGAVIVFLLGAMVGIGGWVASTCYALSVDVSAIKAELETVKPADVLSALHQSDRDRLKKEDVQNIVANHAPWVAERPDWALWRKDIDRSIEEFGTRFDRLEKTTQ